MSAMKSLPHTPVASTASAITATMMAKAFSSNAAASSHHKRGLAEMMAPPPTPTAPAASSYLDCQSLQSSLKRVRLSSSPGELRLHRDLRHMVSSGTWVPQNNHHNQQQEDMTGNGSGMQQQQQQHTASEVWMWHPPAPPVTVKEQNEPPPPHIELKKVESLRLRLTFEHSVVAWIQVPRMYPHRPPLISRIVYQDSYGHNNANNKQTIQTIVVHEAPPGRSDGGPVVSPEHGNNNNNKAIHQGNTVIYHNWSPVQRLGDLLEFVIETFRKQHYEIYGNPNANNNNSHSNHSGRRNHHHHHYDVSLTYSSSSLSSNSSWSRRSSNSSITTANTNVNTTAAAAGGHRHHHRSSTGSSSVFSGWNNKDEHIHNIHNNNNGMDVVPAANHLASAFLTPNRFDVGYERAAPPTTMDMEVVTVGIPQQVSMMDL